MSYFNKEQPTCKYCSTEKNKTLIKFKKKEDGKWSVMNMDGTPHDRPYCDQMKQKNSQQGSYQPNHQTQVTTLKPDYNNTRPLPTKTYVGGTSTFPVNEEPKQSGRSINILITYYGI